MHWGVPLPSLNSDLCLLGDLKGVVDFDTQVPHRGLKFGMAEQQLHCSQVLGPAIDQSCLGPAHRVGPVLRSIQPRRSPSRASPCG